MTSSVPGRRARGLQPGVEREDPVDRHAVAGGDAGERLAPLHHVPLEDGDPHLRLHGRPVGGEGGGRGGRDLELVGARRRDGAAQLRVQVDQLGLADAGRGGDQGQRRRVGDGDLLDVGPALRLDLLGLEAERLGVAGHDGGRHQLRDVALGLGAQGAAPLGRGHRPVVRVAPGLGPLHGPQPGVVAGPGQPPVAGLLVELLEEAGRGVRRLLRIAPLVDPEVLLQPEEPAGRGDELPRPDRPGAAGGVVGEAALDHGQEDGVLGHALLAHDLLVARDVAVAAPEVLHVVGPDQRQLEEADVADHRLVDVDGDVVLGAELLEAVVELGQERDPVGRVGLRRRSPRGRAPPRAGRAAASRAPAPRWPRPPATRGWGPPARARRARRRARPPARPRRRRSRSPAGRSRADRRPARTAARRRRPPGGAAPAPPGATGRRPRPGRGRTAGASSVRRMRKSWAHRCRLCTGRRRPMGTMPSGQALWEENRPSPVAGTEAHSRRPRGPC